jgi:type II secretion system protein G
MRKQRGFTLIELLIVVAIIGIIAAIAIPNLLDAIERSRQKRSISECKSLASAMQAFSTDYGGYPSTAHAAPMAPAPWAAWMDASVPPSPAFVPDYIQAIPPQDGWKIPYLYNCGPDGVLANPQLGQVTAGHFTLGCWGNNRADGGGTDPGVAGVAAVSASWNVAVPVPLGTLQTHCYQADIIWGDSSFLQAPDGKQKNC